MFPYVKFPVSTKHVFFKSSGAQSDVFKFSSTLEKIGVEWDVAVQNGTYVKVLSDPMEINSPTYGIFSVIKVKADVATDYHTIVKEFWVPTDCVIRAEDYFTEMVK